MLKIIKIGAALASSSGVDGYQEILLDSPVKDNVIRGELLQVREKAIGSFLFHRRIFTPAVKRKVGTHCE